MSLFHTFHHLKTLDPDIKGTLADDQYTSVCETMIEYSNLYFSPNAFVKKLYLGFNGIILLIPVEDSLPTNSKLQNHYREILEEIKEVLQLHLYIYPIFTGKTKTFFGTAPEKLVEIEMHPYDFADLLCDYTSHIKTTPNKVESDLQALFYFAEQYHAKPSRTENISSENQLDEMQVLDSNTIDRLMVTLSYLENINRPSDTTYTDDDGIEYVLKDSDITIGPVNTGLIGKKKWYRISEENPQKFLAAATLFGFLGAHKFLEGNFLSGLCYLISFGLMGILPAVDVFLLVTGNYFYREITYEEHAAGLYRKQEKIYLRKAGSFLLGIPCILFTLFVGYFLTKYSWVPAVSAISKLLGYFTTNITGQLM